MHKNNYPWLDWFRFLAALIVALGHTREIMFVKYANLTTHSPLIAFFFIITRMGNEAVLIFFVLSGFLVGGKALERLRDGSFNMQSYIIDRTTRIFIPLIPAIVLTIMVDIAIAHPLNWFQIIGNIFAMQGVSTTELADNGVLWTLSYEIWFYVLVVASALCFRKATGGFCLILLVSLIFTQLFPHYLLCWLIGAAAHINLPKKLSFAAILSALALCVYGYVGRQVGRGSESFDVTFLSAFVPSEEVARVIFSAGFALLIRHIILIKSWENFERVGALLAASSYTLYLTHVPVTQFFKYYLGYSGVNEINLYTLGKYGILLGTCTFITAIMYWLFERNTKKIRRLLRVP